MLHGACQIVMAKFLGCVSGQNRDDLNHCSSDRAILVFAISLQKHTFTHLLVPVVHEHPSLYQKLAVYKQRTMDALHRGPSKTALCLVVHL